MTPNLRGFHSSSPSPSTIEDFQSRALLNVKGKLLFCLISKRIEDHILVKNNFINMLNQRDCMAKYLVVGSTNAHGFVIANAYGSVPHQLNLFSLERYGVSQHWIKIIKSYYGGLWSWFFSNNSPSSWHRHLRSIFTGCTSSIFPFLTAVSIIIEYVCSGAPKLIQSGPPCVRAFMDDLFLTSAALNGTTKLKPSKYCFVLGKDGTQIWKIKVFGGHWW